jgi:hypothetical protein
MERVPNWLSGNSLLSCGPGIEFATATLPALLTLLTGAEGGRSLCTGATGTAIPVALEPPCLREIGNSGLPSSPRIAAAMQLPSVD